MFLYQTRQAAFFDVPKNIFGEHYPLTHTLEEREELWSQDFHVISEILIEWAEEFVHKDEKDLTDFFQRKIKELIKTGDEL